jgi:hypothetical protein
MASDSFFLATQPALPDLEAGHALYPILASALQSRAMPPPADAEPMLAPWPAAHFGLDRVALYRDASAEEQAAIVQSCSQAVLAEALTIEKYGMYFAAKMNLLATSTQERMLYSMFAADEAVHFHWLCSYLPAAVAAAEPPEPFPALLQEVLCEAEKVALITIVQVLLEGWGLQHYHALAHDCQEAGLTTRFKHIIRDEARHHASGLVLGRAQQLSAPQVGYMVELLQRLLFLVQAGPQTIVSMLERVKGHLSLTQKTTVFAELQCESDAAQKLAILQSCLGALPQAEPLLTALHACGALRPYSAVQCARVSSNMP